MRRGWLTASDRGSVVAQLVAGLAACWREVARNAEGHVAHVWGGGGPSELCWAF